MSAVYSEYFLESALKMHIKMYIIQNRNVHFKNGRGFFLRARGPKHLPVAPVAD